MARAGGKTRLTAGVAVSAPTDFEAVTAHLHVPGWGRLYSALMTTAAKLSLWRHRHHFAGTAAVDLWAAWTAWSVRAWHAAVTARLRGYDSSEAFCRAVSVPPGALADVAVPLLFINAQDDPVVPVASLPLREAAECENVAFVLPPNGGHVGFATGWWPRGAPSWENNLVVAFCRAALAAAATRSAEAPVELPGQRRPRSVSRGRGGDGVGIGGVAANGDTGRTKRVRRGRRDRSASGGRL